MTFGKKKLFSDVSFEVHPKECVCILGKSGSGKTTLMNLMLRATKPTSGTIEVDGVPLDALPAPVLQMLRGRMGPIFQTPLEIASQTVLENACIVPDMKGTLRPEAAKRIMELLKKLGLGDKLHAYPETLSTGERAMLGVARALIAKPMIILADEPLKNLDDEQGEVVLGLLLEAQKRGVTLIVLTSDATLASRLPGRTLTLSNGTVKTTEGKAPKDSEPAHRILEHETEEMDSDTPLITPSGRKVKITAIGSNV